MAKLSLFEYMDAKGINPYTSTPELRATCDLIDHYDGSEEYLDISLFWGGLSEYTIRHQTYVGQKEKVEADARTKSWRDDPERSWFTYLHSEILSQISSSHSEIERTKIRLQVLNESVEGLGLHLEMVRATLDGLPLKVSEDPKENFRRASETLLVMFGMDISPESLLDMVK